MKLEERLKQELILKVKDHKLNKHYDAQLPSFTLSYNDAIYFGHTVEEVINKVLTEMKGETNERNKRWLTYDDKCLSENYGSFKY